jgi:hypothetical protein
MILGIALGVALGLLIFANLRGLIYLGALVAMFTLLLLLLAVSGWLLYEALDATRNFLPTLRLPGAAAEISGVVGGLLANLLVAVACGQVLQQRTCLSSREATVFGVVFYALFLASVLSLPIAIGAFAEGQKGTVLLFLLALGGVWVFVVKQCLLYNAKRRRQIAACLP